MMMSPAIKRVIITAALLLLPIACLSDGGQESVMWRAVGSCSNSVIDASNCLAGLGSSSAGAQTVAVQAFPAPAAIAGPISGANAFIDVPVNWLYQSDGTLTSPEFTEAGQTFIAAGDELLSVTVASPSDCSVMLRKGGPDGEQVGPTVVTSQGVALWKPGEAPLTPNETYYVGIKSRTGKPMNFPVPSVGDVYPKGCAYFDGVAEPGSDLAIGIAVQRDDSVRSTVLQTMNDQGWVLHTNGVYFKARSANVRAIFARMKIKGGPKSLDALVKISRLEPDASLAHIGKDLTCKCASDKDGEYTFAAVYGPDEIPVEAGKTYFAEIIPQGEGMQPAPKRDLLVTISGEKTPGAMPVIYNAKITGSTSTSVKVAWEGTKDAVVRMIYGLGPYKLDNVVEVPKGAFEAEIHPIAPGVTFSFRIVAATEAGGKFETPVYVARTLDAQGKPVVEPALPAADKGFLPLANMDYIVQPPMPQVKTVADISMEGAWDAASSGGSVAYQKVKVKSGKLYMLSISMSTGDAGYASLICDPKGGTDFAGHNCTQNFRTGKRTLRFAKVWKAEADTITIGVSCSKDIKATDLAKGIQLQEVKELRPAWWKIVK